MHAIELRIAARDAEQPAGEPGAPVQHEVERPRDPRERDQRRRNPAARRLGVRDGPRLWRELSKDDVQEGHRDRKSTRLNSSHGYISYAVFFFNDTATTEIYTLSLHDALPISLRLVASGYVMAHAFGVSSPKTTCRKDTAATATTEATPPRARKSRAGGSAANQPRNRWATVSSATKPRRIDVSVMPSCVAESSRYRLPRALRTIRALASPRRIMASMRVRREATSANSAATKKALIATSATMASRRRARTFTA